MILIFGGRDSKGKALSDLWGLRRHKNGEWDWLPAPQNGGIPPEPRFQHSGICLQNLFFVIGGRNIPSGRSDNDVPSLSIQVFNLHQSEW